MVFASHPLELEQWQASFYSGDRLKAEVQLLASSLSGRSKSHLLAGSLLLSASHGHSSPISFSSPFQDFQLTLPDPKDSAQSRAQYFLSADCPDALLYWILIDTFRVLPDFLRVDDYMFYDDQPSC